jgi:hypothetical protein
MKRRRKTILISIGAVFFVTVAIVYWKYDYLARAYADYRIEQVTKKLPICDKVEISYLKNEYVDGPADSPRKFPIVGRREKHLPVLKQVVLTSAEAENVAALWRAQLFGHEFSAGCHSPAYGFRFYRNGSLTLEATVCYQCSNFEFNVLNEPVWVGFNSMSRETPAMLLKLQEVLPESIPDAEALKKLPPWFSQLRGLRDGEIPVPTPEEFRRMLQE